MFMLLTAVLDMSKGRYNERGHSKRAFKAWGFSLA